MKRVLRIACVPVICLICASVLRAQSNSGGSNSTRISVAEVQKYLRQPGGLEKLSARIGDVDFPNESESWGQDDIASMSKRSDVIVIASIAGKASHLAEDGDSIYTTYDLNAGEFLKGADSSAASIMVNGGSVVLSNGHTASLHSDLSDGLVVGGKYIFFLKKEDGSLVPLPGSQGALTINARDNIDLVANRPSRDSKLTAELNGLSRVAVKEKIDESLR